MGNHINRFDKTEVQTICLIYYLNYQRTVNIGKEFK